jgi:hypothetical protein
MFRLKNDKVYVNLTASPGAIDSQQLLFHEQAVGDYSPRTA